MKSQRVLITGGAGFIGCNLANDLLEGGHHVTVYDNLSRRGCASNVQWLRDRHGPTSFDLITADVRDADRLAHAAHGIDRLYHLAGQVAVTTSIDNPRADFEANALGTLNALEAARRSGGDPVFIYSSTNKVYGHLSGLDVSETDTRYELPGLPHGVGETQPLDFHSPYGCSKGAGDQYVRDYGRIYGLKTVVVRQSCIYGYRQFGMEDQGWVAWFVIAVLLDLPITVYGDGKQVRDLLFVEDLLEFYEAAIRNISTTAGQIYNVGGGPGNTLSVWAEFAPLLAELAGRRIDVRRATWRPGDQPVYVSDIRKAQRDCGWSPRTSVRDGIGRLFAWASGHQDLFQHLRQAGVQLA